MIEFIRLSWLVIGIGKMNLGKYNLFHDDCLKRMELFPDGIIDFVLTDIPYGTTECSWDSIIPVDAMWYQLKRLIKPQGVIALFSTQPFSSFLVTSNIDWFKYEWVWEKTKPNGWQTAKNKPMKANEDILIFSPASMGHISLLGNKRMNYNPQGIKTIGQKTIPESIRGETMGKRPNQIGKKYTAYTGFPSNILKFSNITGAERFHPTEKPVNLLEYLIMTYTNENDVVLDFTMGSGSTGVACGKSKRVFIGIENDYDHFCTANERVSNAYGDYIKTSKDNDKQMSLFGLIE